MEIILYLIIGFIGFIVAVSIVRYMFNITDIADYQIKQYKILRQIAYKLEVDEDLILEIDDPVKFKKVKVKKNS